MPRFLSRLLTKQLWIVVALFTLCSYQAAADSVMSVGGTCPRARDAANVEGGREIDMAHVFCGAINKRGRATGYHHREAGRDAATAKMGTVLEVNNSTGVYVGEGIEVWNGKRWVRKRGISSFFPDSCSITQVINSIQHAADNIECRYNNGKWSGLSAPAAELPLKNNRYCLGRDNSALVIQGYFGPSNTAVATAWPLASAPEGNCIAQ